MTTFRSRPRRSIIGHSVRRTLTAEIPPRARTVTRRLDPFAAVTTELRGWFEAELWHTARELLERLQVQYPGAYPDGQLRTLQRRLKEWRREAAHRMVFGTMTADPGSWRGQPAQKWRERSCQKGASVRPDDQRSNGSILVEATLAISGTFPREAIRSPSYLSALPVPMSTCSAAMRAFRHTSTSR